MSRIQQLQSMLEKDPDDVFLNFSLGMEHRAGGDLNRAIEQFDRVIALDGGYLTAHIRKGETLTQMKRFDEARATLTVALDVAGQSKDQHMVDIINELLDALP